MPAAIQRSTICPSCQRLTLAAWSRQISIIDSMQFVTAQRPGQGGRHAEPADGQGLGQPFPQADAAAPGWERSSSRASASRSAWATSGSGLR